MNKHINAPLFQRRRAFCWGLLAPAGSALLAACGPHVRPGAIPHSSRSLSTDGSGTGVSTDVTTGVRLPIAEATPVPTPVPVPARPPNPAAEGTLWFDPTPGVRPEDGTYDVGFWQRKSPRPGSYWFFVAPAAGQVTERAIGANDLPAEPPPPTPADRHHVVRVKRPNGAIAGYWVWNATRRAGVLPARRWEWVGDGRPHLLASR